MMRSSNSLMEDGRVDANKDSPKNEDFPEELTYTLDEAVDKLGYGAFQRRLQFIAGLVWAADSIEVIILSLLGGYLACDWTLQRWKNALLLSCVFIGMATGAPVFGKVADNYGRKRCMMITLVILLVSGGASAFSPSYYWMLGLRTIAGFSLGGCAQVQTLICEYMPTKHRGVAGFYISYFWALGALLVVLLAWAIMTTLKSWRLLLGFAAVPSLIVIICLKWCPESARYYLVSNQCAAAEKLLLRMADTNKKDLPLGRLRPETDCSERASFKELFSPEYRVSILLFWYLTFATAFGYYGIVLISTAIVEKGNIYSDQLMNNASEEQDEEYVRCNLMTVSNYVDLAWTTAAELVGLTVTTLLVWKVNRKTLLCCICITSALAIFLLLLPKPKIAILICLFTARGLLVSAFQLLFVMTSESFPTTLRASALGTTNAWSKIGGLIIPYIVQVMIMKYPVSAIIILGSVILIAGVSALCLPIETRGIALAESKSSSIGQISSRQSIIADD